MSRWNRGTRTALALACIAVVTAQLGCGRSDDDDPPPTPTATFPPSPPPTQVVNIPANSGGNIGDIAKGFPNGVQVNVGTGSYPPVIFRPGDFNGPVTLIANESEGPVVINGRNQVAAISVTGIDFIDVDGFTMFGGSRAVIEAIDSVDVIIENNVLIGSLGDGVRLVTSAGVLIFDNLIIENRGAGIAALGQNTVEIVNNTIYGNSSNGITARRQPIEGDNIPTTFVFLQNNIIDGNTGFGVFVDQFSTLGFESRYNLNNNGYSGVSAGFRDLTADPLFISPPQRNFRVQEATGSSNSPAFDRGDPNTDPFFISVLLGRTIRRDNFLDAPPPDLGYHYPNGIFSPTPVPTHTPTGPRPTSPPQPTNTRPVATPPVAAATNTPSPTPTPTSSIIPTTTATPTSTAAG